MKRSLRDNVLGFLLLFVLLLSQSYGQDMYGSSSNGGVSSQYNGANAMPINPRKSIGTDRLRHESPIGGRQTRRTKLATTPTAVPGRVMEACGLADQRVARHHRI